MANQSRDEGNVLGVQGLQYAALSLDSRMINPPRVLEVDEGAAQMVVCIDADGDISTRTAASNSGSLEVRLTDDKLLDLNICGSRRLS